MRRINPDTEKQCCEFAEAYRHDDLDKLRRLVLVLNSLGAAPPRPRHGQRIGQYFWNTYICVPENVPAVCKPLPCLFYAPDKAIAFEVLRILQNKLEVRNSELERSAA